LEGAAQNERPEHCPHTHTRASQCWLLSSWRQQAAFVLCVSTAQLLKAVSARPGPLLRYVPEFYVSAMLDMVRIVP
jgi:hypothetical protein